jgi:hypothetical protein
MKRLMAIVLFALVTPLALAQEAKESKEPDYNTVREFKSKVFNVQHRDSRALLSSIKLLGSGFPGAGMSVNEDLRTITVRDFPENIAAIDEALKRLDQPIAQTPDLELRVHVLIGSKAPMPGSSIPDDLSSVVTQLRSTLSYTHYGLMTTFVHRTKPGVGIEGSGVAESTLVGSTDRPIFYSYKLRGISFGSGGAGQTLEIGNVEFSLRVPVDIGGNNNIQYQQVGFETPITLKQREKVVIGTTTMRDKALIVVVTANVVN